MLNARSIQCKYFHYKSNIADTPSAGNSGVIFQNFFACIKIFQKKRYNMLEKQELMQYFNETYF